MKLRFPNADLGPRQSQLLSQGHPFVILVKKAPLLQFRNDVLDKVPVTARGMTGRHHEPITGTLDKELFQAVGDFFRPAHDGPFRAATLAVTQKLTQRGGGTATWIENRC